MFVNEQNNATFETSVAINDEDLADYDDGGDDEDPSDFACQVIQRKHESFLRHFEQNEKESQDLAIVLEEDESARSAHLETSHQPSTSKANQSDGVVLRNEENDFVIAQNISPILKSTARELRRTLDEEYDDFQLDSTMDICYRESAKRKRVDDSIDNISLMSTESTRKPKLLRAGSLTKHFRRRMSFGIVTPINNLFRPRRNSSDINTSTSSTITNLESTFNESIKEPIKEKFRQIKDKVCKLSKKKDLSTPKSTKTKIRLASANLNDLKEVCTVRGQETPDKNTQDQAPEFKTPKPLPFPSTPSSKPSKARCKLDDSARFLDITIDANSSVIDKKMVFIMSTPFDHGKLSAIQPRI